MPSEVEVQIGQHIARYIDDGCTIQLGIGGVPTAIAEQIADRRHLGVHTELLVDGYLPLIKSGAIDNSRKTLHPGKYVAIFAIGSQELYDFMGESKDVRIMRGSYVNDPPYVIAKMIK